jgi:hypothetical protein
VIAPGTLDSALMALVRSMASGDTVAALRLLAASPALARTRFAEGATRQRAKDYFLDEIGLQLVPKDAA